MYDINAILLRCVVYCWKCCFVNKSMKVFKQKKSYIKNFISIFILFFAYNATPWYGNNVNDQNCKRN